MVGISHIYLPNSARQEHLWEDGFKVACTSLQSLKNQSHGPQTCRILLQDSSTSADTVCFFEFRSCIDTKKVRLLFRKEACQWVYWVFLVPSLGSVSDPSQLSHPVRRRRHGISCQKDGDFHMLGCIRMFSVYF
jgi:hypothetical protein